MAISRTRMLPIGVTQIDKATGIQTGRITASATAGTVVLFGTAFNSAPRIVATLSATGTLSITTISAGSFTLTAAAGTVDYIAMIANE